MNTPCNPFEDLEVISSYSRADAIRDGVLVDLSALAREAGFKYPVAVSVGVFGVLAPWADVFQGDVSSPDKGQPLYGFGQSFNGRAWDLLAVLLYEIHRRQGGGRVEFAPLFVMPRYVHNRPVPVPMYAVCGPGDSGEPIITTMLPGED